MKRAAGRARAGRGMRPQQQQQQGRRCGRVPAPRPHTPPQYAARAAARLPHLSRSSRLAVSPARCSVATTFALSYSGGASKAAAAGPQGPAVAAASASAAASAVDAARRRNDAAGLGAGWSGFRGAGARKLARISTGQPVDRAAAHARRAARRGARGAPVRGAHCLLICAPGIVRGLALGPLRI